MSDSSDAQTATATKTRSGQGWVKIAIEYGPLILFFAVNAMAGIFVATGAFMVAMIVAISAAWQINRHVPPMLWVTGALVLVFGGLTLYLQDETFIKIKPTIVYTLFAIGLFVGQAMGRPVLKTLLGAAFPPMQDEGWRKMTRNWALFFVAMAVLNEIVWRNVDTDWWVAFKVWGMIPITMIFAVSQAPLMLKYQIEEADEAKEG